MSGCVAAESMTFLKAIIKSKHFLFSRLGYPTRAAKDTFRRTCTLPNAPSTRSAHSTFIDLKCCTSALRSPKRPQRKLLWSESEKMSSKCYVVQRQIAWQHDTEGHGVLWSATSWAQHRQRASHNHQPHDVSGHPEVVGGDRHGRLALGREILYITTSWKQFQRLQMCQNWDNKSFYAPPPLGGGGGIKPFFRGVLIEVGSQAIERQPDWSSDG